MTIASTPEVGAPWWNDKTAFLIGGGASLIDFDFRRLCGRGYICGVNQSMFAVPCRGWRIAAGISIDIRFIKERFAELSAFASTSQLYLSMGDGWQREIANVPGAINLRNEDVAGLSLDPAVLRRESSSGYAALNLAVLKRAQRIVLLGYDYGYIDGRHHYHGDYTWRAVPDDHWKSLAQRFCAAAVDCTQRGIEVINASLRSRIECFTKMTIDDALK